MNTGSALPSSEPAVDELTAATARQVAADTMGRARLAGRLQVAGGHPRLDEDRRRTVADGVHHPALPAAGRPVLAPLGQQPGLSDQGTPAGQ
jgi:hypothetical protein